MSFRAESSHCPALNASYRILNKLHTSFNSNTQVFFNLPRLPLVPLPPLLLLLLVVFGMGMPCWLFGH